MKKVSRTVPIPADEIFGVLADGWSYAGWVVGASHIRAVDDDWPAPGSRIHHSVGPWPAAVADVTVVREIRWGSLLELQARLWPIGEATVRLELETMGPGRTLIQMSEQLTRGPFRLLPSAVQGVLLVPRNVESVNRLCAMASGRARAQGTHPHPGGSSEQRGGTDHSDGEAGQA